MASKPIPKSGQPRVDLAIDLEGVPAPALAGFANRCSVVLRSDFVEFAFWEEGADTSNQVAVARVFISAGDLLTSLWPTWKPLLEQIATSRDVAGVARVTASDAVEARFETPAPLANIAQMARHGMVASVEFYSLSPRAIIERKGDPAASADSLFSVQLPTTLLLAMLRRIEQIVPQLTSVVSAWRQD